LQYDDNLTTERPTFVTHLECAATGKRHTADEIHNLSRAGKPLLVRYDLDGVKRTVSKDILALRPPDLWRYRELLPVRRVQDIVSLGEATTPLLPLSQLAAKLGVCEILVKDEARLPLKILCTGNLNPRWIIGLVMKIVDPFNGIQRCGLRLAKFVLPAVRRKSLESAFVMRRQPPLHDPNHRRHDFTTTIPGIEWIAH
jgi:hypothetical protein